MSRRRDNEAYPLATFGKTNNDGDSHMVTNSLYDSPWRNSPINGKASGDSSMEERERFLTPVKLDPGWEGVERNPDELNFKNLSKVQELEKNEPPDRWRVVYIIMVIHGVGILMPWNMFITAKSYFEDYKLNSTGQSEDIAEYSKNFMSYVGMFSQIPNVVMGAINLFCQCGSGGTPTLRIVVSLLIMTGIFIFTVAMAMIDSSSWPGIFFWVTMSSVTILNMAVGVYQNSIYGLAAMLPMKYTNAVVFGNNFSGTLVSVINIISLVVAPNVRTSAIYYFVTAILVLLIAFDAYYVLPLTKFFRHFQAVVALKTEGASRSQETCSEIVKRYWFVFKKIWVLVFCVWFVFFVTLAIFPAIQSDIVRLHFPIADSFFVAIFCFLSFNFFAMVGNATTEVIRVPGPRWLWIPVLLRGLIFIPFFLFCNYRPEVRTLPVLISNDYVYIAGGVLMAFTSGYFSSLAMMYAPKQVEPENAGTAGMMMAFFLVLGIVCGINSSLGWAKLIESF
ncbi:equilibrative nucleoside transporter 1-like [Gigantopelta aegis]|uniref:equilibrative nucleoside transporter 1-like n=1 Tax=Gigantopelta aegis TaxID=1735272 RepID=UPI001B88C585|nr:equilibrative nucleoside transporter 1-like [Gigantopelta aegis]XP_041369045.1 equilibrative nucleoside transporter 1-like [Gigantopelta aegis]